MGETAQDQSAGAERPIQATRSARCDRLFDLWAIEGDTGALGALFDSTAPRLLAVAVHLVGDADRAEDLLQAAFLRLVERRESVQPGTPAEAWLLRVIRNQAIDQSRRRGAGRDAASAHGLLDLADAQAAPDEVLQRRELEARLAQAIDELRSPYREVLLARLRHGASAAEIAHLFERSPGQVRVQLHRGLELLRERLPEREQLAALGLLAPSLGWELTATSLEGVREAVLAAASSKALVLSTPYVLTLMSKSKLVGLTALALLFVSLAAVLRTEPVQDSGIVSTSGDVELGALEERALMPVASSAPERSEDARPEAASEAVEVPLISGRVVDHMTGDGVAGALVRVIRPAAMAQGWDAVELARELPELVRQGNNGGVGPQMSGDWPRPRHVDRRLVARPLDPRNEGLVEVECDADGRYVIPLGEGRRPDVLLEFEAAGYGPRLRPVGDEADQGDLRLFRPIEVRVQLVDGDGEPLRLSLPIRISASHAEAPFQMLASGFVDPESIEHLGAWMAVTDPDGRATVPAVGDSIHVTVADPSWIHHGSSGTAPASEVRVHIRPSTRIRFVDELTGEPLGRVTAMMRSVSSGRPYLFGDLLTPGGILSVDGSGGYLDRECPVVLSGWTESHGVGSLRIDDFAEPREHIVSLERGEPDALVATVIGNGAPAKGRRVGLLATPLEFWGQRELPRPIAESNTDGEGRVRFAGAPGTYVLLVGDQLDPDACVRVELPGDSPVTIDLDQLGEIQLRVTLDGRSLEDGETALVQLRGEDRRLWQPETNRAGELTFRGLPAGTYRLRPLLSGARGQVLAEGEERVVELLPAQALGIELALSEGKPGRCRLTRAGSTGAGAFEGWRAKTTNKGWKPVGEDGVIAQSIERASTWVEVEDDEGRRYRFFLSDGQGTETVVELGGGNLGYRGQLTDGSGSPIASVWVEARPTEADAGAVAHRSVLALTDAEGRFRIGGLDPRRYELVFKDVQGERLVWEPRWKDYRFRPTDLPAAVGKAAGIGKGTGIGEGAALGVVLERAEDDAIVTGRAVDEGGEPLAAFVYATAMRDSGVGGKLIVSGKARQQTTGDDGLFELRLPSGVPCRIEAWLPTGKRAAAVDTTLNLDPGAKVEDLRLVIP